MPLPPYPVAPAPGTWNAKDLISTARLTADLANAALLLANRPLFYGAQSTTGQSIANGTITPLQLDTEFVDSWQGHLIPNAPWRVPLAGVYLADGDVECNALAANTQTLTAGIQSIVNGSNTNNDGGKICGNGVNNPGATCADLIQLDPATTDGVALYGECIGGTQPVAIMRGGAKLKVEWVGLPVTGASAGTVVSAPQPAAMWPKGSGSTITNAGGIAAAATSVTVSDPTGVVIGGTLGLDWLNGSPTASTAEAVTVTGVAGSVIGITATLYPHAQAAPVAVPVSAAFLNQQARDAIRFLSYPPMACLDTNGSSPTLGNLAFPAGSAITFTRANIDNFGAWNGTSGWVAPVAGLYYVFGQVYLQATASYTMGAGLRINSGTTQWGSTPANQSTTARTMCATVRRHLRLNAGDTIQLLGTQNSGAPIALQNVAGQVSKLIVVFRSF